MKLIEKELERVHLLQEEVGYDFITSQEYKEDREWHVLAHFAKLLEGNSNESPVYADKTNPPDPDFITFDRHKNEFKSIEIVEVLAPQRERTKEYKESARLTEPRGKLVQLLEGDAWSTFRSILRDKFLRFYGKNCWLVIYHDISYAQITMFGSWHNTLLANVKNWKNFKILDFDKCPYEKVFVTDASQQALVTIFPSLEVLVPERTSSGYTQILQ
jgi:hypothetical protein